MPEGPARGVLITLEGGDGAGKSTQARALADLLRKAGRRVLLTGEPAGTGLGRTVRSVLRWVGNLEGVAGVSSRTEMLIFEARRAEHVERVIRPALERGEVVLCDRFTDSTLAYQGYGRGLGLEDIRECNRIATGGLAPDLTLVFDVPPEAGLGRADAGGKRKDAIGGESMAFHRRVRDGYLALAAAEPGRFAVIDATLPREQVTERAWAAVRRALPAP
jgi:dTMP kinase